MNTNENDAFQAGEPAPTSDSPLPDVAMVDDVSALDRFLNSVKPFERWGILAGVGIQLIVLFALILIGGWKTLTGGF